MEPPPNDAVSGCEEKVPESDGKVQESDEKMQESVLDVDQGMEDGDEKSKEDGDEKSKAVAAVGRRKKKGKRGRKKKVEKAGGVLAMENGNGVSGKKRGRKGGKVEDLNGSLELLEEKGEETGSGLDLEKGVGRRGRKKAKIDEDGGENGVSKCEEEVEGVVGVNGGCSVVQSGYVIMESRLRTRHTRVVYSEKDAFGIDDEEDDKKKRRRGRGRKKKKTKVEDQKEGVEEEQQGNGPRDMKGVSTVKRGRKGRKKAEPEVNGVGDLEKGNEGLDGEDGKRECNDEPKRRMRRGNNRGVRIGKKGLEVGLEENEESLNQEKVGDSKEAHTNGGNLDNDQEGKRNLRPRAVKAQVPEQEKPKINKLDPKVRSCLIIYFYVMLLLVTIVLMYQRSYSNFLFHSLLKRYP